VSVTVTKLSRPMISQYLLLLCVHMYTYAFVKGRGRGGGLKLA
jgi:hypothetical protein